MTYRWVQHRVERVQVSSGSRDRAPRGGGEEEEGGGRWLSRARE